MSFYLIRCSVDLAQVQSTPALHLSSFYFQGDFQIQKNLFSNAYEMRIIGWPSACIAPTFLGSDLEVTFSSHAHQCCCCH